VFLVVNNQYGMGTALARHSAVTDLSSKAECLGVPGDRVDGMDVLAVRGCVAEHVRLAREERQPTLIEALTYGVRGQSAGDPEVHRGEDEHEIGAHGVAHELADAGAAYAGAGEVQKRRRAQEHGPSVAEAASAEGADGSEEGQE